LVYLYDNKQINKAAVDHFFNEVNDLEKAKYPLIFLQVVDAKDPSLVKYNKDDPLYEYIIEDESQQS